MSDSGECIAWKTSGTIIVLVAISESAFNCSAASSPQHVFYTRHVPRILSSDDAAHVHRWRFGRRWRAEQAKQLDPNYGQEPGDEDTWDAALGCAAASNLAVTVSPIFDDVVQGHQRRP